MAITYGTVGILFLLVAPVTLSQSPSCSSAGEDGSESAAALHQIALNVGQQNHHSALETRKSSCGICDLDLSTVKDSNNGGTTFLTLPAGMNVTFLSVCTVAGQTLDLVLTTMTSWTTKLKNDKVVGNMSQMNLKSGTSVTWDFQLVSTVTSQPVQVDNVIFSVLDLDSNGNVFQQVKVDGFSAIAAGNGICEAEPGVFASMRDGDATDNPTSTMQLNAAQEDSVLSLNFKKVSRWQVSMSIPQDAEGGRNFFIAGSTQLMPTTAVCGNTLESTPVPLCPWSPTPAPTQPTPIPTPAPTLEPVAVGGKCPRGSTLSTIPAVDGETRASWILASNGTVYASGTDLFEGGSYKTEVFTEYLTGVKAIASGMRHTLFLMENGVVCGRGTVNTLESPLCDAATTTVKDPIVVMTGVTNISAHERFSIFLKENGDLYGCGRDVHGELGQGSTSSTPRRTPVLVSANVKSAWAGGSNIIMELLNGSTFVTGSDGWRQFGFNSKYKSPITGGSQTEVPLYLPPPEGLKPFGSADYKFWYMASNGTLFGQGMNYYCEMGLPKTGVRGNVPTNPRTAPVVDNVKAVASKQNSVFLLKNGTAYTSGRNDKGQVGDGSKSERCGLYWVMDHVQAVATGYYTSFLLGEDGTVYGAGDNSYSQLGNTSYGSASTSFVKILTID